MVRSSLGVGDIVTRSDLAIDYGRHLGHSGGIVASDPAQSVLIFIDPDRGHQFGYVYDGFSDDGSVLHYTGAGASGDQQASHSNAPILTAARRGRTLRVFVAVGTVPGSQTKRHRYVGEFILDPDMGFERMPGMGEDGLLRTVLVFRLLPVAAVPESI